MLLREYLADLPLVAILRGLRPENAESGRIAARRGGLSDHRGAPQFAANPSGASRFSRETMPETVLVGAGTVLDPDDVNGVLDVGGKLIVMPHADVAVIARAKELRMVCTPGVATPTEAFAALRAGADGIKVFPAEAMPAADRESVARGAAAGNHRPAGGRDQARIHEGLSGCRCDRIRSRLRALHPGHVR